MNVSTLELFINVATLGSFAKAARLKDIDPSQVSRTIAALEEQLNIQLFQRSTRKLTLTEAGQCYLDRISPLVEEFRHANEEALNLVQQPKGKLRITASTAFGQVWLLPQLPAFQTTYPDIEIELIITDQTLDLLEDNIDIAFRLSPTFDSTLIGVKLFNTHYHACASQDYLERSSPLTSPSEISSHDCIAFALPRFNKKWIYKSRDKDETASIPITPKVSATNALAVRECIKMGMGVGILANWMSDELIQEKKLINLFPDTKFTATDFETAAWLLYPSRKFLPLRTRVFIDFIKANL